MSCAPPPMLTAIVCAMGAARWRATARIKRLVIPAMAVVACRWPVRHNHASGKCPDHTQCGRHCRSQQQRRNQPRQADRNPAGNPSGKPPGKPDASSPFGYTPDISQVFGLTASEFQARFDSQTVPAAVLAGSNFTATVRYTNTGNLTWSGATNFKLGSQNPQDNLTWGIGRIPVAGSVGLNGSTSFTINATAPTTPGKYAFQWRMLQEAVAWFGDYTPTVLIDVIAPSNGASFVSQVPPLTVLTSGRAFSIPITFKNTGTTTWTSAAKYRLGSQGPQDNNLWLGTSNRVALPKTVLPG